MTSKCFKVLRLGRLYNVRTSERATQMRKLREFGPEMEWDGKVFWPYRYRKHGLA